MSELINLYKTTVPPEWVDYNQHMSEGYYAVAFCDVSEVFLAHMGIGEAYRARTAYTVYTIESHITYLNETKVGKPISCTTQLLDYDAKRMHVFHRMYQDETGDLCATFEVMMIHVDSRIVRSAPMSDETLARFAQLHTSHSTLPQPEQVGHRIQIRRR